MATKPKRGGSSGYERERSGQGATSGGTASGGATSRGAAGGSARVEAQKERAREVLSTLKAPKVGQTTTLSVGERTVTLSKSRPAWTADGNTRARYSVRFDSGVAGNTEFFSGSDGWGKAKRYARTMLGL